MRRLYYIKPQIQHSMTILFTLTSAVEMLFICFFLLLWDQLHIRILWPETFYFKLVFSLLFILLFCVFNLLFSMRISHHFVGPLVQIQRVLDEAMNGKFDSRVQLRANDFLHEIGDRLNRIMEYLAGPEGKTSSGGKEHSRIPDSLVSDRALSSQEVDE